MAFLPFLSILLYGLQFARCDMITGLGSNLFGHKCSYFWRYANITMPTNNLTHVTHRGNTCTAMHLNYVGRHGARYPATDDFVAFDRLKAKILAQAANIQLYPFLQTWQNFPAKAHGHIEDLGRWELHYLGNLYGSGLYDMFRDKVSPSTIKLTGSSKKRTRTSASEFYYSLSKRTTGTGRTDIKPTTNDTLMRNYEHCPYYEYAVWNNRTNRQQQYLFQNSSLFQNVIKNVSQRLGMNESFTMDDIQDIYLLCPTELGVRNSTDWCDLMTEQEREVVNYEHDLEDYYTIMYGHPMIPKMSCTIWEDVFMSFENAIAGYESKQEYVLGALRFGHSTSTDQFYASLGLFHDDAPLMADSFYAMRNRTFYESKVTPFSAHVAFILYNCGGSGPENYLVKMMVNGNPMVIPACGSDTCPYNTFKAKFTSYYKHCDFTQMCQIPSGQVVG